MLTEPLPPYARARAARAKVTNSPPRILNGVKSLSYAGNMLGTGRRERGFDEALLVTPHGRVLEAGDLVVLLGQREGRCARRRSRTTSWPRSRAPA